jgi:hypothetical protein
MVPKSITVSAPNRRFSSRKEKDSSSSSSNNNNNGEEEERIVGHCSLSLEQLCKVALAGGTSGGITTNVARILVSRGRPMSNVDTKTMQVEVSREYMYDHFTTNIVCIIYIIYINISIFIFIIFLICLLYLFIIERSCYILL